MNKLIRVLALTGLCLASSLSQAVPITRNFSATGFAGGGTLTGSFTGEDTGGTSGVIEASLNPLYNELTALDVSYSGGTEVGAFSLTLADFLSGVLNNFFAFIIDDESIGFAFRNGDYGSAYLSGPTFFPFAPAFALVASGCSPEASEGCESFDTNYSVPEPGTLSLLGLALFGLARHRRLIAPRRV